MDIQVFQATENGFNKVVVEHKNETIIFETKTLYSRLHCTEHPFFEINEYLEELPEQDHDRMFQAYCDLSDILMEGSTEKRHLQRIVEAVKRLLDPIKPDEIKSWLIRRPDFAIPTRVSEDTSQNSNNPKETTYDTEDYTELAVLSIAMRLMIPIWGMYYEVVSQAGTNYLETLVMVTISGSEWSRYTAFDRLRVYCEAIADKVMTTEIALNHALSGLSSTEVPVWLRNRVLMRRVVITDVLGMDNSINSRNLVTNLYFLTKGNNTAASGQRQPGDVIRPKRYETNNNHGEEDKSSIRENYKMKQALIEGDYVLLNECAYDFDELIDAVDPSVPAEIRQVCEGHIDAVSRSPVYPHQIKLMQAALWRVIPPKGIPRLDIVPDPGEGNPNHPGVQAIRIAMVATQALLWHWGFVDIAIFLTVEEDVRAVDESGQVYNPKLKLMHGGRSRSSTDEQTELDIAFPYVRKSHKKKSRTNTWSESGRMNMAKNEIEYVLSELTSRAWLYKGSTSILRASNQKRGQRHLTATGELLHDLVKFYCVCTEDRTGNN